MLSRNLLLSWLFLACVVGCSGDAEGPKTSASDNQPKTSTPKSPEKKEVAKDTSQAQTNTPPKTDDAKKQKPPKTQPTPKQLSLGDVVEQVDDAVVYITSLDALGNTNAWGSGCVIGKDGIVATNFHVMAQAAKAYVQLRDGGKYDVEGYLAVDRKHDLAILKLKEPPEKLETFELKLPEKLRQADELISIGHPNNFKFTVNKGIVSAVRTTKELPPQFQAFMATTDPECLWIQTDLPLQGGSSGGALLDQAGSLVGVNTWVTPQMTFAVHVRHLLDLNKRRASSAKALPLPGTQVITDPQIGQLSQDFFKEYQVYVRDMQFARTMAERQRLAETRDPVAGYLSKLLMLAEKQAKEKAMTASNGEPATFEPLFWASVSANSVSKRATEELQKVQDRLREQHIDNPRLRDIALGMIALPPTPVSTKFLREVLQKSPHHEVRGAACISLAEMQIKAAASRGGLSAEIVELLERCVNEYGDVVVNDKPLGESAKPVLFRFKHLTMGRVAPEIQGEDIQGEPLKLSDYRGKVVVLDFWAEWCPHCRDMYPHERQMVERYKDKPFALLGVNADKIETARGVVESGKVTWRSWADGPQGAIAQQWQITSFPTVYVLDGRGVIRYVNVRGEQLDQAVESLFEEMQLDLPEDLITLGDEWKYLDDGSDQGTAWRTTDFDDSAWKAGATPAGFGNDVVKTKVSYGENADEKRTTSYFRKTFEVTDPTAIKQLILQVRGQDGLVVYLNGEIVARENLAGEATFDVLAERNPLRPVTEAHYYRVDPRFLRPGKNVIAAEVHLDSKHAASLYFALTLSSQQPDLKAISQFKSPLARTRLLQYLYDIAEPTPENLELMERLSKDQYVPVRVYAQLALAYAKAEGHGVFELPKASGRNEEIMRKTAANLLNKMAWDMVKDENHFAPQLSTRALRFARGSCSLAPENGPARNTLGVAQYRAGFYEPALLTLRESMKIRGENPADWAFVAMAYHKLGNADRATLSMEKLTGLMNEAEWKDDAESQKALQEATALIQATP